MGKWVDEHLSKMTLSRVSRIPPFSLCYKQNKQNKPDKPNKLNKQDKPNKRNQRNQPDKPNNIEFMI